MKIFNLETCPKTEIGGKASSGRKLSQIFANDEYLGLARYPYAIVIPAEFYDCALLQMGRVPSNEIDFKTNCPGAWMALTTQLDDLLKNGDKLYAVRSSASGEDGSENAFAGIFDTFLNVRKEDVVQHLVKCWLSVNSLRAREYLSSCCENECRMSVIVQEMVCSDISGVAFSQHPTSGKNEILIEAIYGLGEPLVSGEITPDKYSLENGSWVIKTIDQRKMLRQCEIGGSYWQYLSTNFGGKQKLSSQQLEEIRTVIQYLKAYFKFEVDVEWTYECDQLFILQSRPITVNSQ